MTSSTYPSRLLWCFVSLSLVLSAPATAVDFENGDFDDATTSPWTSGSGNTPPNGQTPARTNNGVGGSKAGSIGQIDPNGALGANPSHIIQTGFACDVFPGKFCSISFSARLAGGGMGEKATVGLVSGGLRKTWEIPPSPGFVSYGVSVMPCGSDATVDFGLSKVLPFLGGLNGRLDIDDVSVDCFAVPFDVLVETAGPDPEGPFLPLRELPAGMPAVSEWGFIIMTLLLLTAGTIMFGRRRRSVSAVTNAS